MAKMPRYIGHIICAMWFLLCLTSAWVTDFELVTSTGDLQRLLSAPPSLSARSLLRDHVLLHNALGVSLHTPLHPGGSVVQPDAVQRELRRVNASRVLELGYGKGFNVLRLASSSPNVTFVAVGGDDEAAKRAASRARLRTLGNVEFRAADMASLSCADPFDAVFSIESLPFTDPATLLSLLRRCVRPGGVMVLVDAFTADGVAESAGEARTALRLVEAGFGTRVMPSVSHWRSFAPLHGFSVGRSWDWTSRALPFWDTGAWASRKAMFAYSWLPSVTQGHVVASVMAPHALRGGAATYGGMVLHREL